MFLDSWVAILALCCIAWASWMFISNRSSRAHPPLPPGPLGLPVVGSLPFLEPELHTYFANLTKTYGPLVTLRKLDMVTAGTDTTSNTLEFAMAEIVNKPNVLRKAQQELDTLLGPAHGAAALEEAHALQLPYLQAIMKETLRLHPILPLMIPHRPSESCVVGAHTVPKDSRIFVNVWAIQRDPLVWEDPLEFKPERFLGGSGPDFSGSDFGYFPFGSGRRICAGIAMAERMVLYSLASMLYCFDWKLPQGVEKLDLEEKFGITLKLRTPLLLIPSPRSPNLDEMSTL